MGLLTYILERLFGRARLLVFAGDRPAMEIKVEGKEIVLDIKNLMLAAELGIAEFVKKIENTEKTDEALPDITGELKAFGYRIKVRYGRLELEI